HDSRSTHRARFFASPILEKLKLRLDVARTLPRKIWNVVTHADTRFAVARGTNGAHYPFPSIKIGSLCRLCGSQNHDHTRQHFHRWSPFCEAKVSAGSNSV